jgi:hypothetical protein
MMMMPSFIKPYPVLFKFAGETKSGDETRIAVSSLGPNTR